MGKTIVQLLIFLVVSLEVLSQEKVTITIDSVCFQSNETTVLDGSFGLYGDVKIAEHPFWIKDTLLKVLEFRKEQVLTLEPMQYILRYIPDDSKQNEHSVTFYSQHGNVNLSCFFFNKSYPLALRTMKNNYYIEFISRYAGNTNMNTMIPIHSLIIVKKRRNYYALYQQAATNEHGRLIGDIPLKQVIGKKIKIDENYMKLTNEQLLTIEEFWNTMHIYWLENDYSGSFIPYLTIINVKNGRISFQSKGSISTMLWDKLN